MSVLNFPRIYCNGHMFWNPPTANNNDVYPLYDAVKMDLNWPFLSYYGITPDNARTQLMPWIIAPLAIDQVPDYVLQVPGNASPSAYPMIPAEWDLFGDNACGAVNYKDIRSRIIGGEFQANTYIDQDALVNKEFQLLGNPFGSNSPTPARFVDVSPWQNTFTALYFDKLVLGDSQSGLTLNREYRMLDRFLNFNWGALGGLNYVTTTWQTCFPKDNLQWIIGDSVLLQTLQQQMEQQQAQGLMFRFSTYLTFYDRNGIFNDYPPINTRSHSPADLENVQAMYQKGLDNVADIFFNPAYSRTAGTLGLWFSDEFPTAPSGRRLIPQSAVPLSNDQTNTSAALGITSTQIQGSLLSLDLGNTFPFYPLPNTTDTVPVAEKYQAGDYQIGFSEVGLFIPVAKFGFDQYNQAAFDKRSGILDLDLKLDEEHLSKLQSLNAPPLELRLITGQVAATQQKWTAEVIESGSFIDVGDTKTLNIMVQCDGKPAVNTTLWVAEYNNPFMLTTSNYYLAFDNDIDFVLFFDDPQDRSQNKPSLPQFVGTAIPQSFATLGSGRDLGAIESSANTDFTPISYQSYLKTPAALVLSPCLEFAQSIAKVGTLDNGAQVDYNLAKVQTNAQGIAQVTITAVAPGFPTLRFFVQESSDQEPATPFSFNYMEAYTDFLAPLRVLPEEPNLMQDFINYWNSIYTQKDAKQQIWDGFIYPRIFEPFYYLYPIMDKYMPLNSLQRIEGAIDQLLILISKSYQEESTLAMPITRDLPQSRRAVLERWANDLVKLQYPPRPLS